MRPMIPTVFALVGLSMLPSTGAFAAPPAAPVGPASPAAAPATAREADDSESRPAFPASAATREKVRQAVAQDPRGQALVTELRAALKIPDRARRKAAFLALSPKVNALRAELLKKAGVGKGEIATIKPEVPAPPLVPSGTVLAVKEVATFPDTYKSKSGCPDESDTWDFDGKKVIVRAVSAIADQDCDGLRAGRASGSVAVPPGATKARFELTGHVDLNITAASLGVFAKAMTGYGVRVEVAGGNYGMGLGPGNTIVPITAKRARIHTISVSHEAPEGLLYPIIVSDFVEDLQPGDNNNSVVVALPAGTTSIKVTPYVIASVDADLSGIATADSDIKISQVRVSFIK